MAAYPVLHVSSRSVCVGSPANSCGNHRRCDDASRNQQHSIPAPIKGRANACEVQWVSDFCPPAHDDPERAASSDPIRRIATVSQIRRVSKFSATFLPLCDFPASVSVGLVGIPQRALLISGPSCRSGDKANLVMTLTTMIAAKPYSSVHILLVLFIRKPCDPES